ncbi:MAG: DUF4810 domain-containing protein [Planctomycetes bacterium]|nr:DUF4810 domain-containing protein [Planctomycetota bacterium]
MRCTKLACVLAVCLITLCACEAPKTLYHWGRYEDSVHRLLEDPDKTNVPEEIRGLSAEVERDLAEGRRAAPGVHAYLGYLYYLSGNPDSARMEFEAEKAAYPESQVFIDGVLRRMKT